MKFTYRVEYKVSTEITVEANSREEARNMLEGDGDTQDRVQAALSEACTEADTTYTLIESDEKEKYFNVDILCDIYFRGGIVTTDVEFYAKHEDDLLEMAIDYVKEEWGEDFYANATEYGELSVRVNYTSDDDEESENEEGGE